ncbi:MAG: RdgB/HAM1 family non-canonical purine NTP pyrophosphatase [Synechococcus sp. SB0668_bin_15]|nr:RdgB/HAM1 family non-canonical purine NTP pyrophosphatase [Synechococcus sp. SB0668_bin_15]
MTKPVLVIASSNTGKLAEFHELLQEALPHGAVDVRPQPAGVTVEETGADFLANACLKATAVARFTGAWALADDSGLCVDALDGRPGVHSARYAPSNARRLERLLEELAGRQDRSARFITALALARPDGSIALTSQGISNGHILEAPIGEGGFGYDPLFWVPAVGLSFAQMTPAQKRRHGHRGRAFAGLQPQLAALLRHQADSFKAPPPGSAAPGA